MSQPVDVFAAWRNATINEAALSAPIQKNNAHLHLPPNFSAFESVTQAVTLADDQNVRVLGASNYYDFSVYSSFASLTRQHRIVPLFGIEIIALLEDLQAAGTKINDPGNPGKMYLCGKGMTRFEALTPAAARTIDQIRSRDSQRMAQMITLMARCFSAAGVETGLNERGIKERIAQRHGCALETIYLQERHVAQAFQEDLFRQVPPEQRLAVLTRICGTAPKADAGNAVKVQNELRAHLMKAGRPAFAAESFIGFEEAYALVLQLGGIPCYPVLADGAAPLCAFEADASRLASELLRRRIYCAEFIPARNTPEVLVKYVSALRRAGIVVTAGTEHNSLDLLPIEPACAGGKAIPAEIKDIFWEGACVVAAHQYLSARNTCGYADHTGALNTQHSSSESRIQALQKLGASVISHLLGARS